MHPNVGQWSAVVGTGALRALILMVREGEIDATAVDINGGPQAFRNHRRTFNVPARPAAAPWAGPAGLILARRLPQHEIGGVLLVGRHFHPRAGDHLVQRPARQAAVTAMAGDIEKHMAFRRIGMAHGDQQRDHVDHRRNAGGGVRVQIRALHTQGGRIFQIECLIPLGDHVDAHALGAGLVHDLVVDIGNISGVDNLFRAIAVAQQALQHIEHHGGTEIADMRPAIDGRAADIHRHPIRIDRHQFLLGAGSGVIQTDHQMVVPGLDFSC